MGKTSSAVKRRWNSANYDTIQISVPKGHKAEVKAHADSKEESVNAFVNRAIDETIKRDKKPIKKKTINEGAAFAVGNEFLRLAKQIDSQQVGEDYPLIPEVVISAFSCEVFLKVLISKTSQDKLVPAEHDLKTLFFKLDVIDQEEIKQNADIVMWKNFIDESSKAFESWRYAYEREFLTVSTSDLIRFSEAIRSCLANKGAVTSNSEGIAEEVMDMFCKCWDEADEDVTKERGEKAES